MLISSLYVAVNTSGVQNYLKQNVIDYINIDSNNYLQIGKSSFNLKGEVVGVLMDGMVDANAYTMTWDASNLASGVYMIRAEAGGQIATQKVMLVK